MLAQKAVTDFQAGFQAIWDGIVDFINGIIPELGTTISDGFSSIFSGISEIGKNVVEGLWQGIEGSKDWLHEKLDQFSGWMPDWMKNALGKLNHRRDSIADPLKTVDQACDELERACDCGSELCNQECCELAEIRDYVCAEEVTERLESGVNLRRQAGRIFGAIGNQACYVFWPHVFV
jgi:hypothetical protein